MTVRISDIPDYSAESLVGELLEVLHDVDDLAGGVRILDQAIVSLKGLLKWLLRCYSVMTL